MRTTIEKTEVTKRELKESFVLWEETSKAGDPYLTGHTSKECGEVKLVGYYNPTKKNPKEPDIRVYTLNAEGKTDKEIASLWESISKSETRYLTGTTDEKEKLIAFYKKESDKENSPYIRAYFKD